VFATENHSFVFSEIIVGCGVLDAPRVSARKKVLFQAKTITTFLICNCFERNVEDAVPYKAIRIVAIETSNVNLDFFGESRKPFINILRSKILHIAKRYFIRRRRTLNKISYFPRTCALENIH